MENDQIRELLCRFIINLPEQEYSEERFFNYMQKAYWHYKDFMLDEKTSKNGNYLRFQEFCETVFREIPQSFGMLSFDLYNKKFQQYMQNIPVYGAILLNCSMTKIFLVTNMNKKYYNFPKGKVNEGESGVACAIREIWEEIGMDISKLIREDCVIEYNVKKENKTMYVVVGVNENYKFTPNNNTRNEIGSIKWISIKEFERRKNEDKFFLIRHFLEPLKLFIQVYSKKMNIKSEAPVSPDKGTVIQKIDEILNRSASAQEDPGDEAKEDDDLLKGLVKVGDITVPLRKLDNSEMASCPDQSGEEDDESKPEPSDIRSRLEKRVQVFAEELEKKTVQFTVRLSQPDLGAQPILENPLLKRFSLKDL